MFKNVQTPLNRSEDEQLSAFLKDLNHVTDFNDFEEKPIKLIDHRVNMIVDEGGTQFLMADVIIKRRQRWDFIRRFKLNLDHSGYCYSTCVAEDFSSEDIDLGHGLYRIIASLRVD